MFIACKVICKREIPTFCLSTALGGNITTSLVSPLNSLRKSGKVSESSHFTRRAFTATAESLPTRSNAIMCRIMCRCPRPAPTPPVGRLRMWQNQTQVASGGRSARSAN